MFYISSRVFWTEQQLESPRSLTSIFGLVSLWLVFFTHSTVHKILTHSAEEMRANGGDQPQFLSLLMGICNGWKWTNTSVATNTMVLPLLSFPASGFYLQWENINVKSRTLWFSQMRGKTVWPTPGYIQGKSDFSVLCHGPDSSQWDTSCSVTVQDSEGFCRTLMWLISPGCELQSQKAFFTNWGEKRKIHLRHDSLDLC